MDEDTNEMIVKAFSTDVSVDEGERAVTAIISTNAVDRDGEVLIPQGLNSKDYERNPVVFFNHSYADYFLDDVGAKLPVGKCVALTRKDDSIIAKTVFATRPDGYPADKEWLPDTLFSLYQQGVMNAFSVGFIPTEMRPATDKDVEKFGAGCRRVYSKWKMHEYSVVPLPANQEAITLAVSKGLIKADVAKRLFESGLVKQSETSNADLSQAIFAKQIESAKTIIDAIDETKAIVSEIAKAVSPPEPKRHAFNIPPRDPKPAPKIDYTKAVESAALTTIAKARGRVYFV